jgi:hypothetical protein
MFQWIRQQPDQSFANIVGMDPRADYLLGPGFHDFQPFGPNALIPALLVARSQDVVDFVNGLLAANPRMPGEPVPVAFARHRDGKFAIGDATTVLFTKDQLEALANPQRNVRLALLQKAPKQIQLCLPLNPKFQGHEDHPDADPSVPIPNPDVRPPPCGWPPGTVVVGIIDDGIAFANVRFRHSDQTTRVACFWHQDGFPPTPLTVQYGAELAKPQIDALLLANSLAGTIDEDAVYRRAGQTDFTQSGHKSTALRLAHGTHVLDLAAGADPMAPPTDRPIIAVQLPVAATAEQTGAGLESYVEDAINYIQERALLLAGNGPKLPVVINFSYGTLAGPHDGTFPLESAIDSAVQVAEPKTCIVLPSGNSNLGRGHARFSFSAGCDTICLHWRVQPDSMAPSLLQIWMPFADANPPPHSRVCLSITPPDFNESPELGESPGAGLTLERDGEVVCNAVYSFQSIVTERGVFNIYLQPTVRQEPTVPPSLAKQVASSGTWTITLRNCLLQPEDVVEAWIERDGLVLGYPRRGRQSYFDETTYGRFNPGGVEIEDDPTSPPFSIVKRESTINALATGADPVVVGGFKRKDFTLAKYSAGGPITPARGGQPPSGMKPDGASVSDDSYVHYGVLGSGTKSGSTVPLGGTSVAAPQVAKRWVANQLAAGEPATRADFEAFAMASDPGAPPVRASRRGAGRVNFPDTMKGPRTRYWP